MNTLQDLRSTLDLHAADVTDTSAAERVASVTGRARVVRRRRAAGVAAAAVLTVGAASVIATVPGGDLSPSDAPGSMTSLGWRYGLADTVTEDGDQAELELEQSDLPRLVSWSTDGSDQAVLVRLPGGETWSTDADDFGDFVWVPPGFAGRVAVSGPSGLEVATYELDRTFSPVGTGEGITTLREDVAGYDQVGAAVGEPGQASIDVPVDTGPGELALGYVCPGLPENGYQVNVSVGRGAGSFNSEGVCSYRSGFDPGGSTNVSFPGRWGPGSTLRMWVTHDGDPVSDGELPDLRLGLAAYAFEEEPLTLAGHPFPRRLEYGGKVFEVVDSVETGAGELPALSVPEDGDYVVSSWLVASPSTPYSVGIGGTNEDRIQLSSGMEGAGNGSELVRPGADSVDVLVGDQYVEDVRKAALVLYRRVE